jgi:hypothetical protein
MSIAASSRWLFLASGFYALGCIPIIHIAGHFGFRTGPVSITQLLAVVLCFPASIVFLWTTRGLRFSPVRWLAVAAGAYSGLWLAFVVFAVLTFDMSGMD